MIKTSNINKTSFAIALLASSFIAMPSHASDTHTAQKYNVLSNVIGYKKPNIDITGNIEFAGKETIDIDRAVSIDGMKDNGKLSELVGGELSSAQINQLKKVEKARNKAIEELRENLAKDLENAGPLKEAALKLEAIVKRGVIDYKYVQDVRDIKQAAVTERAFNIKSKDVVLKNLNLKNFSSQDNGGAIHVAADAAAKLYSLRFYKNETEQSGGAINNVGNLFANGIEFIKNKSENSAGAFNNASNAYIEIQNSLFKKNVAINGFGGAVRNLAGATFRVFSSEFVGNKAAQNGGAIQNAGKLVVGTVDFINNKAGVSGGAINNLGELSVSKSLFEGNFAKFNGGAINNRDGGKSTIHNTTFSNNKAKGNGGAINNAVDSSVDLLNTSFYGNTSVNGNGGAIANAGKLRIFASNTDVVFSGNTAGGNSNAIHNFASGDINLLASAGYKIIFRDSLTGNGTLGIGDSNHTGVVVLDADMSGYTGAVTFSDGFLKLGNSITGETNVFSDFTVRGGTLNAANKSFNTIDATNWNVSGTLKTIIDVDLALGQADYFKGVGAKDIEISKIDILNTVDVANSLEIKVADAGTNISLSPNSAKVAYGNIFAYDVDDARLQSEGLLTFTGGNAGYRGYNPPVVKTDAASRSHFNNITDAINTTFNPRRVAAIPQLASGDQPSSPFVSAWVESYYASEDVDLDGLTVDNDSYFTIVGGDIRGENIGSWTSLYSVYTGYIGSDQKYSDVKIDQDGLIVGASLTLEKGNLYNVINSNITTSFVDSSTSRGNDSFNIYSFSVANKMGAKLDITDTILAFEPSLVVGYHYVHTDDYTNADGVRIESDGLNIFTFTPELKFALDLEGSFKPYVAASYNWNLEAGGDVKGDGVLLPTLSVDSYAEFKLGTEAEFEDGVEAFAEIQVSTGDREGLGAQVGVKWNF